MTCAHDRQPPADAAADHNAANLHAPATLPQLIAFNATVEAARHVLEDAEHVLRRRREDVGPASLAFAQLSGQRVAAATAMLGDGVRALHDVIGQVDPSVLTFDGALSFANGYVEVLWRHSR